VPDARNDKYSVSEDFVLTKTKANGVLLNDFDANGDPLTVTLVSGPTHGTLSLSANGAFTYDSDKNYHGADSFTYSVSDGRGGSDTATVNITVVSVKRCAESCQHGVRRFPSTRTARTALSSVS